MIRAVTLGLVALVAGACATAPSENAEGSIGAWALAHYGGRLRGAPQIFQGDFTGDGATDAFAWVMYNDGGLHNFGEGTLFRGEHGRMIFWRIDQTASGENPRDVVIRSGRITLITTVLQDGDARCCPTGSQSWSIATR